MKIYKFHLSLFLFFVVISFEANAQTFQNMAQARQSDLQPGTEILVEFRFPFCCMQPGCEEETNAPLLDSIADLFKAHPGIKMEIVMHTDSRGNDELNLELSQKRAEMVKSYLLKRDIHTSQLVATGKGESDPVYNEKEINQFRKTDPMKFEQMHQENRRSILRIIQI